MKEDRLAIKDEYGFVIHTPESSLALPPGLCQIQSVGYSNTDVLESPCLLCSHYGTSQFNDNTGFQYSPCILIVSLGCSEQDLKTFIFDLFLGLPRLDSVHFGFSNRRLEQTANLFKYSSIYASELSNDNRVYSRDK
ncbi:hypothetical protein Tco_1303520 [Tanacetum coccineum]